MHIRFLCRGGVYFKVLAMDYAGKHAQIPFSVTDKVLGSCIGENISAKPMRLYYRSIIGIGSQIVIIVWMERVYLYTIPNHHGR